MTSEPAIHATASHAARSSKTRGVSTLWALALALATLVVSGRAQAQDDASVSEVPDAIQADLPSSDAQACLACHRFPGLSRYDADRDEVHLFFTSERYYLDREGPHSRLDCVDCHDPGEVEQIPHDEVSAVDCGQACHLTDPSGTAVNFSHEHILERVESSVHGDGAMADLPWEEPPLGPDQAQCLYCHDEPLFAEPDLDWATHRGLATDTRCSTCHDEGLPVDVEYSLKHTMSRLSDARPVQQTAEVCAVCHSRESFVEAMDSHDVVASYFRSFHGKASLLGNKQTATCMDCHQTETGDAHALLSHEDRDALTYADNLALTCRSAQCHPNAVPEMSAAGVHLDIDPDTGSPEFFVIAAFVILTMVVMTIYFGLVLLELLNVAFRRPSKEHRDLVALADAVMATPEGRRGLVRLSGNQRVQHWFLAIFFILLVLTGMPLKFATQEWAQHLAELMGGVSMARTLHRISGVILLATFIYHLVYLLRPMVADVRARRAADPSRSLLRHCWDSFYDSPMMIRPRDLKDFLHLWFYLLGLRKHRPDQGRFHFSQKFEYWAVFWGMAMIGTSGVLLWSFSWMTELVGGRAVNFAFIVHSDEAFLALMYIAVVHFFAVVFSPSVFPLSRGSLTGAMPTSEIAENHAGLLKEVAAELGITAEAPPLAKGPKHGLLSFLRRSYAFVLAVALGWLAVSSISFLGHELRGHKAVVDVEELPLRLDSHALAATDHGTGPGGAKHERFKRGPIAHFHQIPTWYTPDPGNGCSSSGCHDALPHGERKETRAFLNMHSTFVDCQTCHLDAQLGSSDLLWVTDDSERTRRDPPAVLLLAAALTEPLAEAETPELKAQHKRYVALLEQAVAESNGDPELTRFLLQLQTTRIGGPKYRLHVDEMRHAIYLHGHGEYGAKVGLTGDDPRYWTLQGNRLAAADSLRADDGSMAEADKERLVETVHEGLAKPEARCTRCHSEDPELVDFANLGYADARVQALRSNSIVRQSQAIERGETFYLPLLLQQDGSTEVEQGDTAEATETR